MAHDETNNAHQGDIVKIRECRPLSALKRWELFEIVERAK
jgi:small subunit ribosomal protein S17